MLRNSSFHRKLPPKNDLSIIIKGQTHKINCKELSGFAWLDAYNRKPKAERSFKLPVIIRSGTVIDKISVEMIGENEESIRIIVFTFMRGIEHAKIKNYNRHANPKKCPLVNLAILLSLL